MSLAVADEPHTPRRVIASRARAAAIVERVAQKHDLTVTQLLCAKWDRFAVTARAEVAVALRSELKWSLRVLGEYLGCSHTRARNLLSFHENTHRRLSRLAAVTGADARVRELEAELQRLSGSNLAERYAQALGLRLRCAIVLAILAEAYPNHVRGPALLSLYDEAREHFGYGGADGSRIGATTGLLTKNTADLAAHFAAEGWPAPSEVGPLPGSRRLSDAAAEWLHVRTGAPKLSQVLQGREHVQPAI